MRQHQTLRLARPCGYCGVLQPVGTTVVVIRCVGQSFEKIRCLSCDPGVVTADGEAAPASGTNGQADVMSKLHEIADRYRRRFAPVDARDRQLPSGDRS